LEIAEEVVLVDDNDNILGYKLRSELTVRDRWRICGAVVVDGIGNTMIAQRSAQKKHDPLHWGPGVAGTLCKGETYEQCVLRELHEELGIIDMPIKMIHGSPIDAPDGNKRYCVWYTVVVPSGFVPTLQEDEVATYRWLSIKELIDDININRSVYLNSVDDWLNILITLNGK
jgi:isopentenyl-diphosphate Delta-isomerase